MIAQTRPDLKPCLLDSVLNVLYSTNQSRGGLKGQAVAPGSAPPNNINCSSPFDGTRTCGKDVDLGTRAIRVRVQEHEPG